MPKPAIGTASYLREAKIPLKAEAAIDAVVQVMLFDSCDRMVFPKDEFIMEDFRISLLPKFSPASHVSKRRALPTRAFP